MMKKVKRDAIARLPQPDSLLRYDVLEARQTSKPQNRRPFFDVEPVLHRAQIPLSQLHSILFIVVTRFVSAIPIGQLYKNTMSSVTMTVHKLTST